MAIQAAKRRLRMSSRVRRKAGSGAQHMVLYVSRKGSQISHSAKLPRLSARESFAAALASTKRSNGWRNLASISPSAECSSTVRNSAIDAFRAAAVARTAFGHFARVREAARPHPYTLVCPLIPPRGKAVFARFALRYLRTPACDHAGHARLLIREPMPTGRPRVLPVFELARPGWSRHATRPSVPQRPESDRANIGTQRAGGFVAVRAHDERAPVRSRSPVSSSATAMVRH